MSLGIEGFDEQTYITGAESRRDTHFATAALLRLGEKVVEMVAKNLADEASRKSFHNQDLITVSIDPKELMAMVGETNDPNVAVDHLRRGALAIGAAKESELYKAGIAHKSATDVQQHLDNDSAA